MTQAPRLWTSAFIFHCLAFFFIAMSFYFMLPTLPLYVTEVLQEDKSRVGYIIGVYAISALIIRPLAGYSFDKFGRRSLYIVTLFAYVLLMAGYHLAASFLLLLLLRFLQGVAWGIMTTGSSTITADIVPNEKRGEGIGMFGLSMTLAMALGPILAIETVNRGGYTHLFWFAVILGFMGFMISLFIKIPKVQNPDTKITWKTLFEEKAGRLSAVMLLAAVPYAGMMSFVTLYAEELKLVNGGLFFLVLALGIAVFRPFAGKIMDVRGPSLLMAVSFVFTIAGLVYMGFVQNLTQYLIAGFIIGVGNGIIMPVIQTMVINLVPADRRGVANGTFFSSIDLGIGIGSVILGYTSSVLGLANMFIVSAAFLFVSAILFFTLALPHYHHRKLDGSTPEPLLQKLKVATNKKAS
ncbi:MAG: MFS transporter [Cyclobacteriaceae bacterium]|nr:MFS transporter [Cyclobacteriaceae bacterium]MCH8516569.1 MFS transporter [Cyclobacteriaceae bacterium]